MSITMWCFIFMTIFNDMLVHVLFHLVSRVSLRVCLCFLCGCYLCQSVLLPFCAQARRCQNNGGNTRVKNFEPTHLPKWYDHGVNRKGQVSTRVDKCNGKRWSSNRYDNGVNRNGPPLANRCYNHRKNPG